LAWLKPPTSITYSITFVGVCQYKIAPRFYATRLRRFFQKGNSYTIKLLLLPIEEFEKLVGLQCSAEEITNSFFMKILLAHNFYGSSAPSSENTTFLTELNLFYPFRLKDVLGNNK